MTIATTISAQIPRNIYSCNGSATEFAIQDEDSTAVYFISNADIIVYHWDDSESTLNVLTEGVEYSLSGGPDAGIITTTATYPSGDKIAFRRKSTNEQATTFPTNGGYEPSIMLDTFGISRLLDQELLSETLRSVKVHPLVAGVDDMSLPYAPGKVLYLDSSGLVAASALDEAALSGLDEDADDAAASAAAAAASAAAAAADAASLSANYTLPSSTVLYTHVKLDDISGSFNGVTDTFALDLGSVSFQPATSAQVFVILGGVIQDPGVDYDVNASSQIVFTTAPPAGMSCEIRALATAIGSGDIAFDPTGTNYAVATDTVHEALVEIDSDLTAHINDASAAHAASAIGFTPTATLAATDVQAAIAELDLDLTAIIDAHVTDASDAHDASAISYDNAGTSIAATNVQAALTELDGRAPATTGSFLLDDISGGFDGVTATFDLEQSATPVTPINVRNCLISLGGVMQSPGVDFTVSTSTITFTTPPLAGTAFFGLVYNI